MNEEPPTPLYPEFANLHARAFSSCTRSHRFMGTMDGVDMYYYEYVDGVDCWTSSCMLVWGTWAKDGWGGFPSMDDFHRHQRIEGELAKRMQPIAEIALKLVQLHR